MRSIEIKFSNRFLYTFILVVILIIAGVCVYAVTSYSPDVYGHDAEGVNVNIGGTTMTLQEAIDGGHLSGSSSGGEVWQENGNNIYYSEGKVGIGGSATAPQSFLSIGGNGNSNYAAYTKNSGVNSVGLYGVGDNSGVRGTGGSYGVYGDNINGNLGQLGTTTAGVYGESNLLHGNAIYGKAGDGAYAGYFNGNTRVEGNLDIIGSLVFGSGKITASSGEFNGPVIINGLLHLPRYGNGAEPDCDSSTLGSVYYDIDSMKPFFCVQTDPPGYRWKGIAWYSDV